MATYVGFNPFVENVCEAVHNLGSDQLTVALCSSTNTPSTNAGTLASLTQVTYTNLTSRNITLSSSAQTGGTYSLKLQDLTLTASGGSVSTFRYVAIYNDTSTGDRLICYYDHGSNVTLATGETFDIDFDGTNGLLQLAEA